MKQKVVNIELLLNPFCLYERDYIRLYKLCKRHKVTFQTYNLWDINDDEIDELPSYISSLICELRKGEKAGSVYSNVFINGERILINAWHTSFRLIEEKIVEFKGEALNDLCSSDNQSHDS